LSPRNLSACNCGKLGWRPESRGRRTSPRRGHRASHHRDFPDRRPTERLEIHCTPKHGSWLNIAEVEPSALNGQSLRRRIPSSEEIRTEIAAWQSDRNDHGAPVNWRFTTKDARIKLTRLYPKL